MRSILALVFIAASCVSAWTQQTIVVDTCKYSNGVLTVDGVQVNSLNLTQLNLSGGTVYPTGTYLVSLTTTAAGTTETYVPYTPSAASGVVSSPAIASFSVASVSAIPPASQTITTIVPVAAVYGKNYVQVFPLYDPGAPIAWNAVVNPDTTKPNTILVRMWNRTSSNATLAAGPWIAVVY